MILSLLVGLLAPIAPAAAQPDRQDRESVFAWRATKQGRILPLKEIENRVIPTMKGAQYIGFTLDQEAAVYTLKFLRDGNVIWVDVDGRNGQVIGRTGR